MRKTKISLACAAALASSAAFGQQNPPTDKPIATVEIKSNADAQRRNDTATKIVVGRDEIIKFGDQSALDVLKRLPGVTVDGGAPRMRGLGAGYTQILVNGERAPAGFSLETLSPEQIERIEVMRAATAEFSTQAIAGTINVVLRKTIAKASHEVKTTAGGSPGGRNVVVNAAMSEKSGRMDYTLATTLSRNEIESTANELISVYGSGGALNELRRAASSSAMYWTNLNVNARVTMAVDSANTFTWQAFTNSSRLTNDGDERTMTEAGPADVYPHTYFHSSGMLRSVRTDLNWVARFGNGSRLDTKAGLYTSRNARGIHILGVDDSSRTLLDRIHDTDIHDRGWTWTGKHSTPLVEGHALAAGWDASRSYYGEGDVQTSYIHAPQDPTDFDTRFVVSIKRLAIYVQDEWDVTPTWSVYAGARWEGMQVGISGRDFADSSSRYSVPSPIVQSLWKLPSTKGGQVRMALTRTYRAPSFFQLVPWRFYTSVNTALTPDFVGNPNLKPELATGIDAAYEHYFGPGAMVSVSVARRNIDGYIRNTVRMQGTRWASMADNHGGAQVRNLELEAKLPLKALMPAGPQLDLRGSISRNWSRVDEVPGPDNRLDRQPEWSVSMGADYASGSFKAGASASLVAGGWTRSSLSQANYGSVRRDLEAYALFKLGPASQLRVTALNILRPDGVSVSAWQDALSSQERVRTSPSYRGWRLQYEHKL